MEVTAAGGRATAQGRWLKPGAQPGGWTANCGETCLSGGN